jgi:carbamate kinase
VIDKDAASCLLACELGASHFIISTDVDKVALNFGKENQVEIDRMMPSVASTLPRGILRRVACSRKSRAR